MNHNAAFIWILRIAIAVILIMHSVPGMFNNGVNDFGNLYLNNVGFAPVGLPLAWAIKVSHVVAAVCIVVWRFVVPASVVTILILVMGIVMVHFPEGWYVVGGGRNGIEFNFLLLAVFTSFIIIERTSSRNRSNKR